MNLSWVRIERMNDSDLTATLQTALEALVAEASAKGPSRIMTAAERDAVLRATKLEVSPQVSRSAHSTEPGTTRVWVH